MIHRSMEWIRGEIIGQGSFSSVYLATPTRNCSGLITETIPDLMAVKSASVSKSSSLQKEKEILTQLKDCPQILHCFGDDLTVEKNGDKLYNLFLEFASGGSLAQLMKSSGGFISEPHVRGYTKSILQGISNIHENGFVHCDIKLQNILVCCPSEGPMEVKIADFGLAKKSGANNKNRDDESESELESEEGYCLRGTPLYMSPESVSSEEYESPADIWALGCIVAEMITGKPAWTCRADSDVSALLYRIGFTDELPEIPEELCEEGKDFLRRCFVRDSSKRWTAEMLLDHPFVADDSVSLPTIQRPSPRSAFDFPESSQWSSPASSIWKSSQTSRFELISDCSSSPSPVDRIRNLIQPQSQQPNWTCSGSWITVR